VKPIKLVFQPTGETKTCYKYETGDKPDQMTFYLKKAVAEAADVIPTRAIAVTVEEAKEE
jgi:hypothetical protein